jgi:hypothetical protein
LKLSSGQRQLGRDIKEQHTPHWGSLATASLTKSPMHVDTRTETGNHHRKFILTLKDFPISARSEYTRCREYLRKRKVHLFFTVVTKAIELQEGSLKRSSDDRCAIIFVLSTSGGPDRDTYYYTERKSQPTEEGLLGSVTTQDLRRP